MIDIDIFKQQADKLSIEMFNNQQRVLEIGEQLTNNLNQNQVVSVVHWAKKAMQIFNRSILVQSKETCSNE